jgi:hypothetical protein
MRSGRDTAGGFSLIEVLVATTLLILIVVMVGMVFRQSMMSWDSGIQRADGSMMVRSVVGAIERDLRAAVSGLSYTNAWASKKAMEVTKFQAKFVALLPPEAGEVREPMLVTLTAGPTVERKAQPLTFANGLWEAQVAPSTVLLYPDPDGAFWESLEFVAGPEEGADRFPAWVRIEVQLTNYDNFSGVAVRSRGRDGIAGTKDDIVIR